jgi:Short-chain alcohol dehydrogenase of unknown specificity
MQNSTPYRTALVTGASRGIGAAICRRLSALGLEVHAVARSAESLDELRRDVPVIPHVADVTDVARMEQIFGEVEVDVLVNNAGVVSAVGPLHTLQAKDIEQMIAINLLAPMQLCRIALAGMVARKRGHIVNIGSTTGSFVFPGTAPYAASKAGMTVANRVLRHDLVGTNVRVTEVSPGRVHTDIYRSAVKDDAARSAMYDEYRSLAPEDVAEAIAVALTMPEAVDLSFMEITPTDQAPGGYSYARRKDL